MEHWSVYYTQGLAKDGWLSGVTYSELKHHLDLVWRKRGRKQSLYLDAMPNSKKEVNCMM